MYRTHTCGELRANDVNKEVALAGWVHAIRTHGALTFIDLRDRYGITQISLDETIFFSYPKESVVQITGIVVKKPESNNALATGDIEIKATKAVLINVAKPLPIDGNATDEMRLKYRYLDIRNNKVIDNLAFRSEVALSARDFLRKEGFLEIETPFLVKSTPEGARDFVVPSRINQGQFYALPQSPQLYKQLLMIAGADKYFQIARAMRDEDLRADRQPEHTQIDLEMSFVHQKDVQELVEQLMKHVFKETMHIALDDFPVFSYKEAMCRFGSDKPDIRFSLELVDCTAIAKKTNFEIFKQAQSTQALFIEQELSRKQIDNYTDIVKTYRAKGLAFLKVNKEGIEGSVAKFLTPDEQQALAKHVGAEQKIGTILFVADTLRVSQTALGHVRSKLAKDFSLISPNKFCFCWVNDFPLFSYNEDEQKWEPEHHMFSMPKEEFVHNFEQRPEEVVGDLWDLVLNGWELASGSIRVSNPSVQERIMNFVGLDKQAAHEKFGFLLRAYDFGGPIHGGMGIGLDRLVAMMKGFSDIREVIAFPKNKNAQCPMDESPSPISKEQLDELGISSNHKKVM